MDHVREAFDTFAQEYDRQREFVIPEFRQFYSSAVWALETVHHQPTILDIGAGTGLLSAFVLQKFPDAKLTLMDFSENMLDVARKRFAGAENVRYVVSDYSTADLGGPYDIVCSALSIHHLSPEDKQKLFVNIYRAISPGGMFVNADQAEGESPYFTERYLAYWNEFLKAGPLNDGQHEEIMQRRSRLDRNDRLSLQLQWLRNAGFSDVDVVYKNRTFIVTVAVIELPPHDPLQ